MHNKKLLVLSPSERILYEYSLLRNLVRGSVKEFDTNQSYEMYVKEFVARYPFVEEKDVALYFSILLKARFSNNQLSEADAQIVHVFNQKFMNQMYENASKMKKGY